MLFHLVFMSIVLHASVAENINCIKCRGFKDVCDGKKDTVMCDSNTRNCYSMLQDDTQKKIVSKDCANKGFCESAKKNMIQYLTYCKECNATSCNNETDFTQNVFPGDAASGPGRGDVALMVISAVATLALTRAL